jgi:hypothetical protein
MLENEEAIPADENNQSNRNNEIENDNTVIQANNTNTIKPSEILDFSIDFIPSSIMVRLK